MPACRQNWALNRSVIASTFRLVFCWMAAASLSAFSGCGGGAKSVPTGTVSGTVTVQGKPLSVGQLNFSSSKLGVGASGNVDKDGKYSLSGPLPVGDYKAFITFDIPPAQFKTSAADILKSVPKTYQSQTTSTLTATVKEGRNEHNFDLK